MIPFVCTVLLLITTNKNLSDDTVKEKGTVILMTSKQRADLKGLAMNIDPIFQIGKSGLTPEVTEAVSEAFNTRELIKLAVLKNCMEDPREIAAVLGDRTHSQVVQAIGKKIVLYKENKDHKTINLPL